MMMMIYDDGNDDNDDDDDDNDDNDDDDDNDYIVMDISVYNYSDRNIYINLFFSSYVLIDIR